MTVQHVLRQTPDAVNDAQQSHGGDQSPPSTSAQPPNCKNLQRLVAACAVLRFLVIATAIVTAVFALSLWAITIIPAIALAVLYGCLVLCNLATRRALRPAASRTAPIPDVLPQARAAVGNEQGAVAGRQLLIAEEKAGLKIALGIFGSLAIIAIILAAVFLGWRLAAIGGLVIFCYLALLGGPYWLAAIEEDVEQAREDLTGEHRAIH